MYTFTLHTVHVHNRITYWWTSLLFWLNSQRYSLVQNDWVGCSFYDLLHSKDVQKVKEQLACFDVEEGNSVPLHTMHVQYTVHVPVCTGHNIYHCKIIVKIELHWYMHVAASLKSHNYGIHVHVVVTHSTTHIIQILCSSNCKLICTK